MARTSLFVAILLLAGLLVSSGIAKSFEHPKAELIRKYAPKFYLHSKDQYRPSSVDFFLSNSYIPDSTLDPNQPLTKANLGTLSASADTSQMYITSKENLISSTSILEFFKGQDVVKDKVPVYAMINEATGVAGTFDVYYFVFFPYNYGKSMCIWGSDKNGNCRFGAQRMFGNHVGDFEFVALRFTNDQPTDIFISTHLTGKHYKFDSPELEKTDTHVHIYNALGSHGFHNKAGKLKYNDFPPLYDETDAGVEWKSWEGPIEIYNVKDKYEGEEAWLNFQGRWGNKTPCKVASSMSLCQLENGPWTFRGIRLENGKLSIKQGKTF